MTNRNTLLVVALASILSACGGSGAELAAQSPEANFRLASDAATLKPWQTELTEAPTTSTNSPTKVASSDPSPAADPFNPAALPIASDQAANRDAWPTWRREMVRWQWRQLPGTDLPAKPDPEVPGWAAARIEAWNGLAADIRDSRLFSAGNGGHADYAGNEVYEVRLSTDSPRWAVLRAPTPAADILASDYTKGIFHDYYRDGRPSSTHTYYALHFLASRNAIFKFGAGSIWGTGNEGNLKTDSFSLTLNDWSAPGTWEDITPGSRAAVLARPRCLNPNSDEVYVAENDRLKRFDPIAGRYVDLARWPDGNHSYIVYARPCAVDTVRNRVVFFGDEYGAPDGGLVYDIASNSFSRVRFTGVDVLEIASRKHHFAWFEPKLNVFLFKTDRGGNVYAIDPETFAASKLQLGNQDQVPDAANGVHTRWQRLPSLGGYAYYPRSGSGIWFLSIE